MKPHATKPMTQARKGLVNIHKKICRNPHHYTVEKIKADESNGGASVRHMVKLMAALLGWKIDVDQIIPTADGIKSFIEYILDESL